MAKTPTIEELSRLRPNAKGDLYLNRERMATEYKYASRLGKHNVCLQDEPQTWDTEAEALDAAKRFLAEIREALKK